MGPGAWGGFFFLSQPDMLSQGLRQSLQGPPGIGCHGLQSVALPLLLVLLPALPSPPDAVLQSLPGAGVKRSPVPRERPSWVLSGALDVSPDSVLQGCPHRTHRASTRPLHKAGMLGGLFLHNRTRGLTDRATRLQPAPSGPALHTCWLSRVDPPSRIRTDCLNSGLREQPPMEVGC